VDRIPKISVSVRNKALVTLRKLLRVRYFLDEYEKTEVEIDEEHDQTLIERYLPK
jgi:hypothetical protein